MPASPYNYGYWNPNDPQQSGEPILPPLPGENGPGGPPDALGFTFPVTWPTGAAATTPPRPAPAGGLGPSPDYGQEYYDPGKGQIWRKWMENGQEQYAYVREANPWERPRAGGQQPAGPSQGTAPQATTKPDTAGVYNSAPIKDLLAAMTLQYQVWREKLSGQAKEKQTALTAALNFGAQMGYAVAPDWFLRFVHDKETEAGVPPDPSTVRP